MYTTDILIIGAGAVGIAIAREFAKSNVHVMVADKNGDVCGDATRACSSIVGTGYANAPGSLECKLAHSSRPLFDKLLRDLEIESNPCGCIMPAFTENQLLQLKKRLNCAWKNGDYDVEYISRDMALKMEPTLNPDIKGAIFSPREMVIDTFMLVVAQAENAAQNGVEFLLNCEIIDIEIKNKKINTIKSTKGDIKAKYVINAAGLHSDNLAKMAENIDFTVHPRKGQFYILDRNTSCQVSHIIMPVPTPLTRGNLLLPTPHGNMLVGPTAEDLTDKDDTRVTTEGLKEIEQAVRKLVPGVVLTDAITEFAGLRPVRTPEGYHIGFSDTIEGFFSISGVRSDGIGTSLGIAKYVLRLFKEKGIIFDLKKDFVHTRKKIVKFSQCTDAEKDALIKSDPLYGNIICRCETISEAEIVEAIHRPVGARTVDGVKRRVRAGMGRCQGGFCGSRIIDILSRELKINATSIVKDGTFSNIILSKSR